MQQREPQLASPPGKAATTLVEKRTLPCSVSGCRLRGRGVPGHVTVNSSVTLPGLRDPRWPGNTISGCVCARVLGGRGRLSRGPVSAGRGCTKDQGGGVTSPSRVRTERREWRRCSLLELRRHCLCSWTPVLLRLGLRQVGTHAAGSPGPARRQQAPARTATPAAPNPPGYRARDCRHST